MTLRVRRRCAAAVVLSVVLLGGGACTDTDEPRGGSAAETSPEAVELDQALHDELVAMQEADQAAMMGESSEGTPEERQTRLAEVFDQHGWPTWDLVGKDGSTAAWVIAQHADLDVALQQRALELLREAVASEQASPGDLAYLEDRVAANQGRPQTYGTQIGCRPGGPVPATPILDRANVEERRAAAGLEPLADYLAEMRRICRADDG